MVKAVDARAALRLYQLNRGQWEMYLRNPKKHRAAMIRLAKRAPYATPSDAAGAGQQAGGGQGRAGPDAARVGGSTTPAPCVVAGAHAVPYVLRSATRLAARLDASGSSGVAGSSRPASSDCAAAVDPAAGAGWYKLAVAETMLEFESDASGGSDTEAQDAASSGDEGVDADAHSSDDDGYGTDEMT